jgi:PAS domain S-box-containing protein
LTSTTVSLAAGITAAVIAATAAGAYFYSVRQSRSLLATARGTAISQAELIRAGLEHQMMENDRSLIARMIQTFGQQPQVEQVMLLDRQGAVKYSSQPLQEGTTFSLDSPTCQACHRLPPAERESSRVIDTSGGAVLRTMIPVRNQPRCQACHDASHNINGVLVFDMNTAALTAGMDRDLRVLVAGTGAIALVLIALIAAVVRLVLLRRLQRFETAASQIAKGDLNRRVPADGTDTIAWLAREFNTMADSMTGLLDQVHGQQRRLETIINSVDDGIVVLDPHRRIIAANDAFLSRLGHSRDDTVGCSCGSLTSGLCQSSDCPTIACLESHARQVRVSERTEPDGSTRWEEVHASPIVGPDGAPTHVVEVWRDITDRRAAEARMSESHRLASLGMLASGFSHELNTPLATTLTCVEGILREATANGGAHPVDRAHIEECASMAREQVLRARGITQHFLRLSRGQAASADLVNIRATVAAVVRLADPTARAHGVKLVVAPGTDALVRLDDAALQHVLVNLVLNAVQASRPGSEVALAIAAGEPSRIRVIDHGSGIAPENQKRIFEPFFSMRKGGTGLGLFLSLDFARHWGGDITVTGTPGGGATFEVVLPPAAGAAASRPA